MKWDEYVAGLRVTPGDTVEELPDGSRLPGVTTAQDCPSPSPLHFHPPHGESCVPADQQEWKP